MQRDIAETLVEDFERGLLSRRQLASPADGTRGGPERDAPVGPGNRESEQYLPGHGSGSRRPECQQRAPVTRFLHQALGAEGHP